jgi:hypothetical protein
MVGCNGQLGRTFTISPGVKVAVESEPEVGQTADFCRGKAEPRCAVRVIPDADQPSPETTA